MRIHPESAAHLTYCTNIHPGATWEEAYGNLKRFLPRVKQRVAPGAPLGVGLRLSAAAAATLREEAALADFQQWLAEHDLYVFTLNGFVYGPFHDDPVKDRVFEPDWRNEARVTYTLDLIDILAALLPDGMRGSISTSPLSYKPWFTDGAGLADAQAGSARNLAAIARRLERVEADTGRLIQLGLEPEPDGLVETTDELVRYFEERLLRNGDERIVRRYLGICFDTCHASVQYEDPLRSLARLRSAGIAITKVQVSAALAAGSPVEGKAALASLADPVYLHQVRERSRQGVMRGFHDLSQALESLGGGRRPQEWRVHFHVPLFARHYGSLTSTSADTRASVEHCLAHGLSDHLEIETYTWAVLPPELQRDLVSSIAGEFDWVLNRQSAREERPSLTSSA
jgi:sugar phosphate isomerase/epimerase